MNKCGIYQIRNLVNCKVYIGSSKDIDKRWFNHKKRALGGYHKNKHLQSAILKYGINNFMLEILEYTDEYQLFDREQFYLDKIKPEYNKAKKVGGGLLVAPGYFVGKNNPMFGRSSKDIIIEKHGIEKGNRLWNDMNIKRSVNGKGKGGKPVIQIKNGTIVAEFDTITQAADLTGIHFTGIHQVCKGGRKTAGKFNWKYKN